MASQAPEKIARFAILHVLDALGIEWRAKSVTGAKLTFDAQQPPILTVTYLIEDEQVGPLADALSLLQVRGDAEVHYVLKEKPTDA